MSLVQGPIPAQTMVRIQKAREAIRGLRTATQRAVEAIEAELRLSCPHSEWGVDTWEKGYDDIHGEWFQTCTICGVRYDP